MKKVSLSRQIWFIAYRRTIIIGSIALVVILMGFLWFTFYHGPSPVPPGIKKQLNFKVLYPKGFQFDNSSWRYQDQKLLTFIVKNNSYSVTMAEQKVPLAYADDPAAYDRFIGSLRPFANFNSPLGTVSLTHFVTAKDFQPESAGGFLKAKGTLLLAHPNRDLNDNEWRSLFSSMKVDK